MKEVCGYEPNSNHWNSDHGGPDFVCKREKGHKGKHRFYVSWETRKEDIPHEHDWVTYTGKYVAIGGLTEPPKICTFCSMKKYPDLTDAVKREISLRLLAKLVPALQNADHNHE